MIPGTVLAARYELQQPLGHGGMGQVWLGFDRVLERQVAVKVADLRMAQDPSAEERFRREARAAAALAHDHVVTVFDSGSEGSVVYLVMQLLPGPALDAVIRDRAPLPVDEALALAEQAAAALAAMHGAGIVHRDIKPANLMFDDRGRLQVLDFGIALRTASASAELTAASTVVGSAAYISPEQAQGEAASPASDLYALGCVLTALLTGSPPFAAEQPLALLQQHTDAPPPRVRERRAEVPEAVDALVSQLLAKEPEQRPASAAEVRDRIAALRTGAVEPTLPLPAATGGARTLAASTATGTTRLLPMPEAPAAHEPPSRRRSSRRWLAIAGLLVALVVAAVVIGSLLPRDGGADPTATDAATPSAAPTAAAPAESAADDTAAPEPAAPEPAEPQPAEPDAADSAAAALDALRQAIRDAEYEERPGQTRGDLLDRVDDLEDRLAEGRTDDIGQQVDELGRRIDELVREGGLAPAAADAIRAALAELEASLP